jgi:hypothetical protein
MTPQYITYLRERQASTSVGPSTARGMGPPGTIKAAREFLKDVDLQRFKTNSAAAFGKELDRATEELARALPKDARRWGSARKFLNIFLRGCCYNKYLCSHYKLSSLEEWLEIPLDSHVARGLKRDSVSSLPRWPGVIHLTPDISKLYQAAATEVARKDRVHPVHLDIRYWRRTD